MAKTKEQIAEIIFRECEKEGEPVSMEEALEMAEMEIKSGDISHYEKKAESKKDRKPKERKVDEDKKKILSEVKIVIEGILLNNNEPAVVTMKTETELSFSHGGNDYTLKLTKHRKKA